MILFAAATGLRPAEWGALGKREVDRHERVAYVRRFSTRGELNVPKTEAGTRAVPLQARTLDSLDRIKDGGRSRPTFFSPTTRSLQRLIVVQIENAFAGSWCGE